MSLFKMVILCCSTSSGHWHKLAAKPSGDSVSTSLNTFMVHTEGKGHKDTAHEERETRTPSHRGRRDEDNIQTALNGEKDEGTVHTEGEVTRAPSAQRDRDEDNILTQRRTQRQRHRLHGGKDRHKDTILKERKRDDATAHTEVKYAIRTRGENDKKMPKIQVQDLWTHSQWDEVYRPADCPAHKSLGTEKRTRRRKWGEREEGRRLGPQLGPVSFGLSFRQSALLTSVLRCSQCRCIQ